jgi:O-antigen/teichoic acid export membrane protein
MTGSVLSQVIALFTAPILTRIYLPEEYGILGIYMSVAAIFGVFATLMYDQTIVITKHHSDASHLVRGILSMTAIVSGISFVIVFLFKDVIANLLKAPEAADWFLFIPLTVVFSGLTAVFNTWANRHKRYKRLASTRVTVGIISIVISMSLGLLIDGPFGLIVALLSHQGLMGLFMFLQAYRFDREFFVPYSKPRVKELLKEYQHFPRFSVFSELINRVTNQMPVYLLSIFTGKQAVGHYNMSNRMLGLPIAFLSSAVTEVFKQKAAADYHSDGSCRTIYVKTLKALTSLSIVPFLLLAIFAPDLFEFVFGENWRQAGVYTRPLSILFFFKFISSPLSYMYYIANALNEDMKIHVWILLSCFASLYFSYHYFGGIVPALYVYAINYSLVYIYYIVRGYQLSLNQRQT